MTVKCNPLVLTRFGQWFIGGVRNARLMSSNCRRWNRLRLSSWYGHTGPMDQGINSAFRVYMKSDATSFI